MVEWQNKSQAVKALEDAIDEEPIAASAEPTLPEVENLLPVDERPPLDDTFQPIGTPAPPPKPFREVDPAPKISALYPDVKLKNYDRRGSI